MEKMMADMGTEGWGIFPQVTEIEVVESTKGDAFNVYDRRIERANSELSKLIIGQTMTIEDGSSLSQSETHLEVFQNIIEADCDTIRDMVNNQLLPHMIRHGFPLRGIHFDWDYSVDYTPEQQVAYEQLVLNNYEVDPTYFQEKYNMPVKRREQEHVLDPEHKACRQQANMPVGERRATVPAGSASGKGTVPDASPSGKNNSRPFFD